MKDEIEKLFSKYPELQTDCRMLLKMMAEVTREVPVIWSGQMIGFGSYHYKYESGREGDWFLTGFAPRKGKLSIYIVSGLENHAELLKELGPHSTGKSCLYIKSLNLVDQAVLKQLIEASVSRMKLSYPEA